VRCPLSALVLLVTGVLAPATSAPAAPAYASAAPGPASIGIRLVDIPVSEGADMRAWRYIIDHVPPGTLIRRRVLVENQSPSVANVTLYPDAATIRHGSFLGDAGQTRSELTTWTRESRQALRLAPHANTTVTVRIRVPRDASPGERYGVIWAQVASRVRESRQFAVREVSRVGVRIYLDVGPGGPPPTNFAIGRMIASRKRNGAPVIVAAVHNTGGRAVDLSGRLKLSDGPGGITAGPFRVGYGTTLAPGQAGQVETILPRRLPDGPWHAMIDLQSGLTERKAYATVSFATHVNAANSAALRRYTIIGVILIIALGLAFLVRQRLMRRNHQWGTATDDQLPT